MGKDTEVILQVQIAAYGAEGIARVAEHRHPKIEGVRWLVSWQMPEGDAKIPAELSEREDFDILINKDRGVSKNRNHALEYPCNSPYVLLSDDDIDYSTEGILQLIDAFKEHSDADIICCRYKCDGKYIKNYGEGTFSLSRPLKGWYPVTFEMAFRRKSLGEVRFNEKIGPGAGKIIAGEDTIWFSDMMKKGAKGVCVPIDLCEHPGLSTGERLATDPDFLFAKGAMMTSLKPISWFPRVIVHAFRSPLPAYKYLYYTLKGALFVYTHKIF